MNTDDVLALLDENRNERGIANWQKLGDDTFGLDSFGIGLTQLRKLAKKVGRDPELAAELWRTPVYDAKVMGLLIDDPKRMPREQAERQVEELHGGMLVNVLASCDATLAKTPFALDLAREWMESADEIRRRCAYTLFYELSKKKKLEGMDDAFLLDLVAHIRATIDDNGMWVREAMKTALLGIGKRTPELNRAALAAAEEIGTAGVDYGPDNACEPLDVAKHLRSPALLKKLGLAAS